MPGDLAAARTGIVALIAPVVATVNQGWNVRRYVRAAPVPPELSLGIPTLIKYGATLAGHMSVGIPLIAVLGIADDEKAQERGDWLVAAEGPVLGALRGARPAGVHGQVRVAGGALTPRIVGTNTLGDVLVVDIPLEFMC